MDHTELIRHITTAEAALKDGQEKKQLVLTLLNLKTAEEQQMASIAIDSLVWAANNRHLIGGVVGGTYKCCSSLFCNRGAQ